nr:unnamed protein product [Digitaria exilis]
MNRLQGTRCCSDLMLLDVRSSPTGSTQSSQASARQARLAWFRWGKLTCGCAAGELAAELERGGRNSAHDGIGPRWRGKRWRSP